MHQTETPPKYRPILIISEDTPTVRIARRSPTAPRLYLDRASAERDLRGDWPGCLLCPIASKIMHGWVFESVSQIVDLFRSCIAQSQDVGALDLALVLTQHDGTLMIHVLGAFLCEDVDRPRTVPVKAETLNAIQDRTASRTRTQERGKSV